MVNRNLKCSNRRSNGATASYMVEMVCVEMLGFRLVADDESCCLIPPKSVGIAFSYCCISLAALISWLLVLRFRYRETFGPKLKIAGRCFDSNVDS